MEKHWPAANERGLGWTTKYPRPTEDNGHHPAALASRQAAWDAAEAVRLKHAERVDAIRAEREAKAEAERQRHEADRQARDTAKLDALTDQLRRGYLAAPGATEDGFQAALPELLEAHRRQSAVTVDDAARQAQSQLYRNF